MPVEDLGRTVSNGAGIDAEERVERRHVVGHQSPLVALELRRHLGDNIRPVDLIDHAFPSSIVIFRRRAPTPPPHAGAPLICTPNGYGARARGNAAAGSPMEAISRAWTIAWHAYCLRMIFSENRYPLFRIMR